MAKSWVSAKEPLIRKITLYKIRPTWTHLYCVPIVLVYIGGYFLWTFLIQSDYFNAMSTGLEEFKAGAKNSTEVPVEEEDLGLQVLGDNEELTDDLRQGFLCMS